MTHGGVASSSGGAGSLYISSSVETRSDIRKMFIDELGFKELYGTNSLSTAQLGALGIGDGNVFPYQILTPQGPSC
ncbi:MAG: hypothetical protein Q4A43_03300, partial [Coriobacteriia bacterium]|nr:hypothetical protein [Coriobacteriia bacterium]